ncbi:hypothetical protein OLX02_13600 [Novosphingobium sp. KCTC 2891]|uniref:hypothetical protein n=1 Tax=Novosphingobium sp. KCTC 2891 TaxID=2989730 RepID=UPI002222A90E|nr:hypothetical protein [Novosphingobium sp. KCTC 2891]MCW1383854.1 hypothetical protein [Novosphingobium sp. KCTC 2891]
MNHRPAARRERLAASLAVFLVLAILAVVSVAHGTFYDDEAWTLHFMDRAPTVWRVIAEANAGDVHPPLGYVIMRVLHDVLGSWLAVKLAGGLWSAAGMAGLLWFAGASCDRRTLAWSALLLAGAATAVMWGTSLRWYAWFNPLYWPLAGFAGWRARSLTSGAAALAVGGVLLFHTNYLAALAVPPLALVVCLRHGAAAGTAERWRAAAVLLAGALACLPQAWVMARVHMADGAEQTGSLGQALAQAGSTAVLGNAVFVAAPLALAFALVSLVALALAVTKPEWRRAAMPLLVPLIVSGGLLVLSGVGYRGRNAVFLHPLWLLLVARALAASPRWLQGVGLAAALAMAALGLRNVAIHDGTMKRSFNTPYAAAMERLRAQAQACRAATVIHHDPVLGVLLAQAGMPQREAFMEQRAPVMLQPGDCLLAVHGWRGPRDPGRMAAWEASFRAPALVSAGRQPLGRDADAAMKARLSGESLDEAYLVLEPLRARSPMVYRPTD